MDGVLLEMRRAGSGSELQEAARMSAAYIHRLHRKNKRKACTPIFKTVPISLKFKKSYRYRIIGCRKGGDEKLTWFELVGLFVGIIKNGQPAISAWKIKDAKKCNRYLILRPLQGPPRETFEPFDDRQWYERIENTTQKP